MPERLMRGWEALDIARQKGRTRSGAPMRSIKESMISRAPGERAAMGYLRKSAKASGALKSIAKTAGRVGARLAGPVAVGFLASDIYDTVQTTKDTVGAFGQLHREVKRGKEAKASASQALSDFKTAHPKAGAALEKKQKARDYFTATKEAAGGKIPTLRDVAIGKSGNIYAKGRR